MSPGAIFDGKKAIRGGVPVVFPQFGQPDKAMAQHGFARSSLWSVEHVSESSEQSRLVLALTENAETLSKWPFKFHLRFIVELTAVSLTMRLVAKNTGDAPFKYQALLHTYFAVPAIETVAVRGLVGRSFLDKVANGEKKTQEDDTITLPSFTDRVYVGEAAERGFPEEKDVTIGTKDGQVTTWVANRASNNGAACPCDVVVWNPYEEASPGDLPPPAFKSFVCVEPGLVAESQELQPGAEGVVSQKICCA